MSKAIFAGALFAATLALTGTASTAAPITAPAHTMHTTKGNVLVDKRGMTLYTYARDPRGKSTCMLGCAIAWPPFFAPTGAKASGNWTLVEHGMGKQWAYKGHPLYFYAKDKKSGDVTGDGVGGVWHVAR